MIYLDYQSTTPVAPEVAAAMRPWIEEKFANPHSPSKWGREAAAAIEVARGLIEKALFPTPFVPSEVEGPLSKRVSTSLDTNGVGESVFSICSRATSIAAAASRPHVDGLCGLANFSAIHGRIAAATSGATGVVD